MNMTEHEMAMADTLAGEILNWIVKRNGSTLDIPSKDFLKSAIMHELNKYNVNYYERVDWQKHYEEKYRQALKELNEERRNLREKIKESFLVDISDLSLSDLLEEYL